MEIYRTNKGWVYKERKIKAWKIALSVGFVALGIACMFLVIGLK